MGLLFLSFTMAGEFLLCLLVVGLANGQAPEKNFLELYTLVGNEGATTTVTEYMHDLSDIGFDNLLQSVCGQGAWIMYEHKNYNHSDWRAWSDVHASGAKACNDLPVTRHNKVSSIRYAGTGDLADETLTVYHSHAYSGGEIMFIREEPFFGDYNNEGSSIIVTGESAWTLYSGPGYHRVGICVQPWPVGDGYYFGAWSVEDIGMPNNVMSSLQKGCFSEIVL